MPGIGCEACHGPGEKHLVAMKEKKFDEPQIFNPGGLGGARAFAVVLRHVSHEF